MVRKRKITTGGAALCAGIPVVLAVAVLLGSVVLEQVWEANAQAQEVPVARQPFRFPSAAPTAPPTGVPPGHRAVLRPVSETVNQEYTDPKTGERKTRRVVVTRMGTEYQPVGRASEGGAFPARGEQEQKLESQAATLAAQLRDAKEPTEREKLTEQLEKILQEAFAQQQQRWAKQIEQLKEQLDRLEQQHADRQERKDLIVQRRLSQLTEGVDPLDWEPGGPIAQRPWPPNRSNRQPTSPLAVRPAAPASPSALAVWKPLPAAADGLPAAPSESPRKDPVAKPGDPFGPASGGDDPFAAPGQSDPFGGPSAADPFAAPGAANPFGPSAPRSGTSTSGRAAPLDPDVAESADRLLETAAAYIETGEKLETLRLTQGGYGGDAKPRPGPPQAEAATEVAKVRFELARMAFAGLQERLQLLADAAKQQETAARERRELTARMHEKGATPDFELKRSQQAEASATRDLQHALLSLRRWQQAAEATAPVIERVEQLKQRLAAIEKQYASPSEEEPPATAEADQTK